MQINTRIVPAFYALLKQTANTLAPLDRLERLQSAITSLLQAADEHVSNISSLPC
jgi:hypothetical protein